MVNKYYQKIKETLRKEACKRYQNLSEEKRDKKRKDDRKSYHQSFTVEVKRKKVSVLSRT